MNNKWQVMESIFEEYQWYPHVENLDFWDANDHCNIWEYVTQWNGRIDNPYDKQEWVKLARELAQEQDRRSLEKELLKWSNEIEEISDDDWQKIIKESELDEI